MSSRHSMAVLDGEAHVWFAEPRQKGGPELSARLEILSEEERARFERYLRDEDKLLFLTAHVLMRQTLSRYVDVAPARWEIVIDEHGRPEIDGRPLRFNISHAAGLVACLVTAEVDCGVDVEDTTRVKELLQVASTVFTADECDELRKLSGTARRTRFFETWTLKEAYVKARGLGLALPLDSFRFELSETIEFWPDDSVQAADTWQFELLRPSERHIAAVALRSQGLSIVSRFTEL